MSAKHDRLKVSQLLLDPNNARLPPNVRGKPEKRIIEYMLLEANLLDLMQAIAENDFFEGEQLLVVPDGQNKYRVIEGNRRLAAVKLLRDPDLATVQQSRVKRVTAEAKYKDIKDLPCVVFDDEQEIHRYLGFRHITGVQPWNLRQKAEYLASLGQELFHNLPLDQACRELAKIIGSRRDYVKRLLVGFRIYTTIKESGFFGIRGLDDERFYFSNIADSLSRPNIATYLGVDMESDDPVGKLSIPHLRQWTHWLFETFGQNETRLKGTSEDLSILSAILGNESATRAFSEQKRSLQEAFELTTDLGDLFRRSIAKAVAGLEQADRITHKLDVFYPGLSDDLKVIARLVNKLRDAKKEKEIEGDDV